MKIAWHPNPVLHNRNEPVTDITPDVRERVRRMFEICYEEKGVGLAAPQAGWNARIFVLNTAKGRPAEAEKVYVNPEIIDMAGDEAWLPEGCLSLPYVWGKVRRWTIVRVRAQDLDGKAFEETLEGIGAQAVQHEMDHLEGILMYEKLSPADQRQNQPYIREMERRWRENGGK